MHLFHLLVTKTPACMICISNFDTDLLLGAPYWHQSSCWPVETAASPFLRSCEQESAWHTSNKEQKVRKLLIYVLVTHYDPHWTRLATSLHACKRVSWTASMYLPFNGSMVSGISCPTDGGRVHSNPVLRWGVVHILPRHCHPVSRVSQQSRVEMERDGEVTTCTTPTTSSTSCTGIITWACMHVDKMRIKLCTVVLLTSKMDVKMQIEHSVLILTLSG